MQTVLRPNNSQPMPEASDCAKVSRTSQRDDPEAVGDGHVEAPVQIGSSAS